MIVLKPPPKAISLVKVDAASSIVARPVSDVSVVITNFQRAPMLWQAYQSCKRAQVQHIVISSSAVGPDVQAVLDRIRQMDPKVQITARTDDDGCNKNWLRGARMVRTGRMTILHDDDMLLPAYQSVVAGKFAADVVHWDGNKHGPSGKIAGSYVTRQDLPQGIYPVTYLLSILLSPFSNSLSPVCGCFPTSHVISVLEECERSFGSWAYLRPTMMVGNDMLIWLRACERLKTVYYSHEAMCSYGHWDGSASFDDVSHNRLGLLPIYRRTRQYWLETVPHMVHAVPRYMPTKPEPTARIRNAIPTWELGHSLGIVEPLYQWSFKRDSLAIKEPKTTPFLRDVLRNAMSACHSRNDVVVLTNDDTLTNLFWWFAAWDWLKDHGAGCSFRRNITHIGQFNPWNHPDPELGSPEAGRDAFCFRQEWLESHLEEIPDYVMGFGDWDSTLAMLIRLTQGNKPQLHEFTKEHPSSEVRSGLIFHVDHEADWTKSLNAAGMKHNRALTTEFFKNRLGWDMPHLRGTW